MRAGDPRTPGQVFARDASVAHSLSSGHPSCVTLEAGEAATGQPPGWYPAEGAALCWWDGTAWTPYYLEPTPTGPPKRTLADKVGLVLVVSPLAATEETIQIVPVTCPGERYAEIELRRVLGSYPVLAE